MKWYRKEKCITSCSGNSPAFNRRSVVTRLLTCTAVILAAAVSFCALADTEVVLEDDFEAYNPGEIRNGAEGEANEYWHIFHGTGKHSTHYPDSAIVATGGVENSTGMRLAIGVRSETKGFFYAGVRRAFTADLKKVDRGRLKLTCQARVVVRDLGTSRRKRKKIPPPEFFFALRLESIRKHHVRGVRQFTVLGTGSYNEIGGLLTEATPGGALNYKELRIADGPARYQVVIVITSSYLDSRHLRGVHDLEIFIDDIRLEIVEDEEAAVTEIPPRFFIDRCTSVRMP